MRETRVALVSVGSTERHDYNMPMPRERGTGHQDVPYPPDRGSAICQRWLASVMLYCEKGFRRVKGPEEIARLVEAIEREQGRVVSVAA